MGASGRAALLDRLRLRIEGREAVLGFVGLGYVGLPVSLAYAAAGFTVRGHDIDPARIEAIRSGKLPFATSEPGLSELLETVRSTDRFVTSPSDDALHGCDVFFLAVDTPVDAQHQLLRERFASGLNAVAPHLTAGSLVVVESTVPPGTMDRIVIPTLEQSTGLRAGEAFFVLHCPERLRPGRLLRNLRNLSRLVGGADEQTSAIGVALYKNVVFAPLHPVHYRTAEVVKTAENTARDVQIALANQLAVVSDHAGVDVRSVRAAINELWRDEPLVLEPGPGVGGHCLPKDPWLLVEGLDEQERALVAGARTMNLYMATHVVDIARALLSRAERTLEHSIVVVLGIAYDANSDDTRNSPGAAIASRLEQAGAVVRVHDPNVPPHDLPLAEALRGTDLAIIVAAHDQYRSLDLALLRSTMRTAAVLDTRRMLDAQTLELAGVRYAALGVSALRS